MTEFIVKNYSLLDKKISKFTIFGERHSGTKFLEYVIKSNLAIDPVWNFGWKHWIGEYRWDDINKANDVLFIGIVRNIYDWIGGMQKMPHHCLWVSDKSYEELCSNRFISSDIRKSDKSIIYYHDRHYIKRRFYNDIFEARHCKNIFLYHYMPYLADNYLLLRYEDLIYHNKDICSFIMSTYNIGRRKIFAISRDYQELSKNKTPYDLPGHIIELINTKTKWESECIFGYKKKFSQT